MASEGHIFPKWQELMKSKETLAKNYDRSLHEQIIEESRLLEKDPERFRSLREKIKNLQNQIKNVDDTITVRLTAYDVEMMSDALQLAPQYHALKDQSDYMQERIFEGLKAYDETEGNAYKKGSKAWETLGLKTLWGDILYKEYQSLILGELILSPQLNPEYCNVKTEHRGTRFDPPPKFLIEDFAYPPNHNDAIKILAKKHGMEESSTRKTIDRKKKENQALDNL